jgi:hypothetical protein
MVTIEHKKSKPYCIEVPLNGITSIPNFMKIYQVDQKLLVGDTQTDTQTGDLISLLTFLGSRLKIHCPALNCHIIVYYIYLKM